MSHRTSLKRQAPGYARRRVPTLSRSAAMKRVRAVPRAFPRQALPTGETKFHDVDLDDAVVAGTGTIVPTVNIIAQGVTESERIGRKCTISQINWRYQCTLPVRDAQMTPGGFDVVRVIMFLDRQANKATALVTDVLESVNWQSFNNLVNKNRFLILHDKEVELNYEGMASDGAGVVSQAAYALSGSFYKKVNIPIEFNAAAGAMTEITSNNIGVLLISSKGVAGFNSKIRLRFTD